MKLANKPDAVNPAIASQFAVVHHGRGVTDPERWPQERMDTSVLIKSSHDGTTFEFSDYTGGYFQATLHGPHFQGCGRVYAYEPSHLAAFFRDLATHWQGWSGQKKWVSLEEELSFTATSDSTGHTSLAVRLRSGPYPFDWSLTAVLLIEAGQLESIAKKMEALFIAD